MAQNLDKLDEEDLYAWLSQKVNAETASAIKENGISGAGLIDLDDDELKEILPKVGPRKMVKALLADFKGHNSAHQQRVRYSDSYSDSSLATVWHMENMMGT